MINTNGVRIAREAGFAERLAEFMPGFEVYLQFDSMKREALMELRGADLTRVRVEALEALERAGVSTTLVVTLKRGVNDDEIADIVRFALKWRCVRGVTFQPIQDAGRNENFDPKAHRIVLSQIRRRIAEAGVFALEDLIPLPCNPDQICIGYGLRNGETVTPITSLLPRELLVAATPNTVTFESYPELQQRVFDLLSLSTAQADTSEKLASLLCCLPEAAVPAEIGYADTFRVVISQFLDRFNFDLGTVKRSCVHFVEPDGRIIPFDTYNTFYRPGAPGAALRGGALREAPQCSELRAARVRRARAVRRGPARIEHSAAGAGGARRVAHGHRRRMAGDGARIRGRVRPSYVAVPGASHTDGRRAVRDPVRRVHPGLLGRLHSADPEPRPPRAGRVHAQNPRGGDHAAPGRGRDTVADRPGDRRPRPLARPLVSPNDRAGLAVIRFVGGLIAAAGLIWVALCGTCAYSVLSGREFGTPQDDALPFIVVALAMSVGVLTISVGFRVMFASSGGWRGWNAFLAGVLIVIGVLIVGLGIGLGVIGFAMAKETCSAR